MDRRTFLGTVGAGLLPGPRAAEAQQVAKVYRIGLLSSTQSALLIEPFVEEMRERGWVQGQHFLLERRLTGARLDTAPALARELVDLNVDLILTVVTGMAVAARAATAEIPIVMITSGYPVAA